MKKIKTFETFEVWGDNKRIKTYESSKYELNDYVILNKLYFPDLTENNKYLIGKIVDVSEQNNKFYWVIKLPDNEQVLTGDYGINKKITKVEYDTLYVKNSSDKYNI